MNEAFIRYLQQRESQQEYLELAKKSRAGLQERLGTIERDLGENIREWQVLLKKDLADYPDILINEEKCRLKTERESLLQAKARIESELAALPRVDPAEVEAALCELAKPWQKSGYTISHPEFWRAANFKSDFRERDSVAEALDSSKGKGFLRRLCKVMTALVPQELTDQQAHLLRETLLKLNCRITIKEHAILISGKLGLGLGLTKVVQKAFTPYGKVQKH